MCLCFWCSKTEIWPDRFISYRRALFLWFRWWIAEHSTHTRQKTVHLNIRRKCNKSSGSPVWWHKTKNNRKSSRNLHLLLITFFVGDVQCLGYKAKLAPSEKLHQQFWWQSKQTWNVFLWVFMYSENAFALTLWSLYLGEQFPTLFQPLASSHIYQKLLTSETSIWVWISKRKNKIW